MLGSLIEQFLTVPNTDEPQDKQMHVQVWSETK